jgi:hypothetical protein
MTQEDNRNIKIDIPLIDNRGFAFSKNNETCFLNNRWARKIKIDE